MGLVCLKQRLMGLFICPVGITCVCFWNHMMRLTLFEVVFALLAMALDTVLFFDDCWGFMH